MSNRRLYKWQAALSEMLRKWRGGTALWVFPDHRTMREFAATVGDPVLLGIGCRARVAENRYVLPDGLGDIRMAVINRHEDLHRVRGIELQDVYLDEDVPGIIWDEVKSRLRRRDAKQH